MLAFTVSPNEKFIATTNKTYMIRVYALSTPDEEGKQTTVTAQTFKTPGQMGLECCFDPSSRFLAVGTADSHVKVFDVIKGFQTHNFIGHRGVIVQLGFVPGVDHLRLLSSGEDFTVKVWDLVLNKDVATLRGNMGRISCFQHTHDLKTLFVGARDGKIAVYNCHENYKLITTLTPLLDIGGSADDEVTAL